MKRKKLTTFTFSRKKIIQALNKTHNAKEVAECFSVNTSTIYRLAKRMRETGSVETRTSLRGRKLSLSPEDIHNIDQLIQQQSDITIHEIVDRLQLHISDETVRKAVLKLGYVYKKKSLHALEQEHPQCTAEAQNWKKFLSENAGKNLVFLDKSGVNTNMTNLWHSKCKTH